MTTHTNTKNALVYWEGGGGDDFAGKSAVGCIEPQQELQLTS